MKYEYVTETGIIVSPLGQTLSIISGTPGHVDFPSDLILDLHKAQPGCVFKLAHTHPPGMIELSERDKQTLKTLAFTLYPFPIRMSTVTVSPNHDDAFVETTYLAFLESKEVWKNSLRAERIYTIEIEKEYEFLPTSYLSYSDAMLDIIINKSYKNV